MTRPAPADAAPDRCNFRVGVSADGPLTCDAGPSYEFIGPEGEVALVCEDHAAHFLVFLPEWTEASA